MFKVAINCALLKKMIDSLIDKGYLEKTELFHKSWNSRMVPVKRKRTCSWKLTEKGRNFLAKFDEYESVISEIDKLCKL
jgi:predicted transcriptional regulator